MPIPGTRRTANLRANLDAARVDVDPAVLAELEVLVPRDAATGERYNESMSRRLDR